MRKFIIEGQEVELQGIESDCVVIMRPVETLSEKDIEHFNRNANYLGELFARHHISLIGDPRKEATFEVLRAKSQPGAEDK